MAIKQFKDISVDQEFTLNDVKYKKIQEQRISCCRSINACSVADPGTKIQVKPLDEVSIDE